MLNKQRLQAVKDRMLANRDRFQYGWVFHYVVKGSKLKYNGVEWLDNEIPKFINDCGTHCCVAGFTMQEMISNSDFNDRFADTDVAANYLGLSHDELKFLFTPTYDELERFHVGNEYLLGYPNLGEYSYRFDETTDGFDEAIRRIDYLLVKPE